MHKNLLSLVKKVSMALVMSAKLIIHKIEDEINFKFLQISLEQNEDEIHEKTDWVDGKIEEKSKKGADVVVRVVTDKESNTLDLDYCAKEMKEGLILDIFKHHFSKDCAKEFINDKASCKDLLDSQYIDHANKNFDVVHWDTLHKDNTDTIKKEMGRELENFLEHSLVKVKENNSRIWEKIQILNRTLNLITRKTYLDGANPKALLNVKQHTCNECEKCFVYETGLRRHLYLRHGNVDGPRWQTVWTCTECFQVWPQYDGAIRHGKRCCGPNNTDIVREIKASLLLQCEFCEKVFTCIPKLLRHYKDHTVKYNYECKGCSMIFVSYKSAEQHWIQCMWLKQNYTFSLPKMLLCNTCDRKFKNYEQLYNHRYKVGHFFGKSIEKEDLLSLVYQCEVCGQWFTQTSLLEEHRKQQHPQFDWIVTL